MTDYQTTMEDSDTSAAAGFLALVIGLPLLIFIIIIGLCCWCCHCCCCARNNQQVVVMQPSNPTSTVVNTTMMTPYAQGYAPVSHDPGYTNHLYAAQHQHQLPPATGQYAQRQGPHDDQLLFSEGLPKGRTNEYMDPDPRVHHVVSMHSSGYEPENYLGDRSAVNLEQVKPPPYSSTQ